MGPNITQLKDTITQKFFSVILLCALICAGCLSKENSSSKTTSKAAQATSKPKKWDQTGEIILPSGESLFTRVALTPDEQRRGLSGIQDSEFSYNEAMLFFYLDTSPKSFWMPDTYFDLEIIFLDGNLTVLDIERNVAHHPGMKEPPKIASTRSIYCQHVLEVKSASPLAKKIKKGMILKWKGELSLSQIESKIRHGR